MTDEEMFCGKRCSASPCRYLCEYVKCYLAGLKAGRPKWHDLRKANDDLPLNTDPVLCLGSTGFIVCKYISGSWVDNQTIKLVPKYIDIYKWCEIEDTEE